MFKSISKLGTVLSKSEQQILKGGNAITDPDLSGADTDYLKEEEAVVGIGSAATSDTGITDPELG
jgi:hypothetical protein